MKMNCKFSKRSKAFRDGLKFLIDAEDFEKIKNESFCLTLKGYVYSGKNKLLHRMIMNAPDGMDVDHINGDKLDNRKSNLRICTRQENLMNVAKKKNNTSGFKGVCFDKQSQKFKAQIRIDGKQKFLGLFEKAEDAHEAYKKAAVKLHGEFHHF